jgi:hypothetical protein
MNSWLSATPDAPEMFDPVGAERSQADIHDAADSVMASPGKRFAFPSAK